MRPIVVIFVVLVAAGTAFLLGYLMQHGVVEGCEQSLAACRNQLAEVDAKVRVSDLQNRLLGAIEAATQQNYADAQRLSSDFFDKVREEMTLTERVDFRTALADVLQKRDAVIAALARGEPAALEPLREMLTRLRQLLHSIGVGLASPPPAPPQPAAEPPATQPPAQETAPSPAPPRTP